MNCQTIPLIQKDESEVIKMRDPNRLDGFYEEFCKLHKKYLEDWRFGQLCCNFFGWIIQEKKRDPFFPEEDKILEYFKEYCEGLRNRGETNDEKE